jgi:hypothetical protein
MKKTVSQASPYLVSALLGAIFGGILVMVASKAIPTMFTNILSGVMGVMKSKMEACGCNPQEMCQKMMASFTETPQGE